MAATLTRGPRPAPLRRQASLADTLAGAWCALAAVVLALSPLRALRSPDGTDLVAFLTGARILSAGSTCIYCLPIEASAQAQVLGHAPEIGVNPYANPPLAAWLLQPLASMSLEAALAIFLATSVAALALAAVLAWRLLAPLATPARTAVTISAIAVLPGAEALAFGQWDPVLLLAALAALARLRRGDDLLAGLLLASLWGKPQVVWLAAALLLVGRHWRTCAGLVAGGLVWVITGLAIVGPHGIVDWSNSVLPAHVGESGKTVGIPSLAADATGHPAAAFAAAAILAIAAVAVAARRERLTPETAVCAGIALSVVLAPHVYDTDLMLLAPALLLVARRRPAQALWLAAAVGCAYLADQRLPGGLAHLTALATSAVAWRALVSGGGGGDEPGALEEEAVEARVARDLRVERKAEVRA